MADAVSAAPQPGPDAEKIEVIDIEAIRVVDRLRPVSEAHVQFLVGDIWRNGLLTRIEVCHEGEGYRLVAGAHRLEACVRLGWTEINARIVDHETLTRRSREISENLVRHELSPLDRAAHVAEWYQIELQRRGTTLGDHKQKMGSIARWADRVKTEGGDAAEMISGAYDLQDQLAEKLGLTARTIRNDIALYRGLKPEAVAKLRETPIGSKTSQLLALAKMHPDDQASAVEAIASGKASTAAGALHLLGGGREERPEEKHLKVALAAFRRLTAKGKADFLSAMSGDPLPKGFAVTVPPKKGATP
jgi:ParB family chromosome partitioning protein